MRVLYSPRLIGKLSVELVVVVVVVVVVAVLKKSVWIFMLAQRV